jgi:hypothetical protein
VFPDSFEGLGLKKNDVLFGMNLVPENRGADIRIGQRVEIVE